MRTVALTIGAFVVGALIWWSVPQRANSSSRLTGIAIIPCDDNSPNRENDWFGNGLAEGLSISLSDYGQIQAAEFGATQYFKANSANAITIGDELGVDYVLRCTVASDGVNIRITASLAETNGGLRIWNDQFNEPFDQLFELQDQIKGQILTAMEIEVLRAQRESGARNVAPKAYENYLKGLHYRADPQTRNTALTFFERALEIDSTFAEAHSAMAAALGLDLAFGLLPAQPTLDLIWKHMDRAVELNPENMHFWGQRSLFSASLNLDWEASFEDNRRAEEVGLSDNWWQKYYLAEFSDHKRAIFERIENQRYNISRGEYSAHLLMRAGYLDEAEQIISMLREVYPNSPMILIRYGETLLMREQFDAALEHFTMMVGFDPTNVFLRMYQGMAASGAGKAEILNEALELIERADETEPRFQVARAILHQFNDEKENALALLEEAVNLKSIWAISIGFYIWDQEIRNDPRFEALVRKAMPNDAWLTARFNRGGMLINRDEVETYAKSLSN